MSDKNEWSTIDAIKEISPDWQEKTLNCFSTMKRNSFVNGPFGSDLLSSDMQLDGGVPVVYIRDICDGRYIRKSEVFVTFEKAEKLSACKTKYGDILISKVGDPPCEAAIYTGTENAIVTQDVIRVSTGSRALSEFLTYVLNSDIGKRQVKRIKITGTRERVSLTDFKKLKFLSPPLPEQIKIAEILSTWDNAINTVQKLLANSQQQKKALMQQLLTGKKRFAGFEGEWEEKRLGEVSQITKGKAISSKDVVSGCYPVIAGGKTSPYSHNDFTHEKVITVSASGAYAGYIWYHQNRIWASDCSVIQSKRNCDIIFLYYWLEKKQSLIYSLQSGGAQPHIYPKDLGVLKIYTPSLLEQQKIAAVLTTADQEIDNLRAQLSRLEKEKKALMQQLLTGKRRVKVEEAA